MVNYTYKTIAVFGHYEKDNNTLTPDDVLQAYESMFKEEINGFVKVDWFESNVPYSEIHCLEDIIHLELTFETTEEFDYDVTDFNWLITDLECHDIIGNYGIAF